MGTLTKAQADGLKAVNDRTKVGQPALLRVSISTGTAKALEARGLVRISGQYVHMTGDGRWLLEGKVSP